MSILEDAIKHAETAITAEINAATKASWDAGYRTGLETAITCAETIRDKAQSTQGKAAAEAVIHRIVDVRDGK